MSRFLEILKTLGPAVMSIIPGAAPFAPLILAGVAAAEQIPGASGADKKALVQQIVAIGITGVKTANPSAPVDPGEIAGLVGVGIDTVVGVVNVLAKRTPPPAPSTPVLPG